MRIQTAPSLLVFLLCCMYFCSHIFVVSGLCLNDQRSLLLQLESNLKYSQLYSTKLVSWNQTIDCCQWSGVTCDDEGHLTGLDLSGESITGGFRNSSSIFSLQHLQNLNLADNNFNCVIPSGFNKLENLTYQNLSDAGFVGQIPNEISHLTRLVTLDISSISYLTGQQALKLEKPNLRELVRNLINIRLLYLDGVTISAKGEEWNAALLQIPTLQELSMSQCDLSGPLESSLTRLENLSVIHLDRNSISSPVPETFANFKNLTSLSLAWCELVGIFPQKIFLVPTLSFIDISGNLYLQGSLPDFPLNGSLQSLLVSNTNFSGPLPNSIGNLRQLSTLDLSTSQFNGTLPNSLSNLTQLLELDLSHNRFAGSFPYLGLCKKIQRIILSYNNLTGSIPSTHFLGLANLVDIHLQNNFFTGNIPSSIFMLPSLQSVLLSSNEFVGQLNDFINASSRIQLLDLSNNHLEGHIPIFVFQLRELFELRLSSNEFNDTIDLNMISKLGNLTRLDLSKNNLSIIDTTRTESHFPSFPTLIIVRLAYCKLTTFPQFLKNQSGLRDLDLSNNYISGTVPNWIWNHKTLGSLNLSDNYLTSWEEPLLYNMSYLYSLDLHSNNLQEPLPALPLSLFYLDYSSNNLSSAIPPNIGNYLFYTIFLSFSSNKLYGNIPESICNAPYLEVLDLSNNALTGSIPKCLNAMIGNLTILDLGRNKLNGTIDSFPGPGSCALRTLHLNGNSLQGKLPKYLVNCAELEVLDLGDNQINDQFPCWLKSISTLRVLILRSNKLQGTLKCGGPIISWPHLQIVDIAANNFGVRIPLSFFKTWKAMKADVTDKNQFKMDHLQYEVLAGTRTYYQDRVTVTSKQQQMELVKILTIFTAIDLSSNKFEGVIPEGLGQLNALYILNLSHNAFSGHIPSSLGNLKDLESLDLSNNNLSGEIPTQLASISFLSFMDLSHNHLVGRIPTSTQIQSFEAASFKGNDGLCGPPLTQNCSHDGVQGTSPPTSNSNTYTVSSIDWNFISIELGFTFGIGIVVLPLVFCKPCRIWYWKHVDSILYRIFPQLDLVYECRGGQRYRTLRWNQKDKLCGSILVAPINSLENLHVYIVIVKEF